MTTPSIVKVNLVLWRRRFRCLWCLGKQRRARTFSEPDPVCGLGLKARGRLTTQGLRQNIAAALSHQTVKWVAEVYGMGQRFVRECFAERAGREIAQALPKGYTPRVLGLDEFSMKRGMRYETIFYDPCALPTAQPPRLPSSRSTAGAARG